MNLPVNLQTLYRYGLIAIFVSSALTFILLYFVSAPYGKFSRKGWGLKINSLWAWMIMELPAALTIALSAWFFRASISWGWVFLAIWEWHYLYRTFIFPLRMGHGKKTFPILILLMAIGFNVINGLINGLGLFLLRPIDSSWFARPQFIIGLMVFAAGFILHCESDNRILSQKVKTNSYIIPQGGLFRLVSCPNYLGEIIQWFGWALLTWSFAGLAFAVFTFANVFPRGIAAHKWYKTYFKDYPAERRAILPFTL